MKLSIIIVNYKTGPLTKVLVESLLVQDLPKKTEIIVVDNDSQDESVSFLRSDFPDITVIESGHNGGLAFGVNTGLRAALGDYCLVLNPDMVAPEGAPAALVEFMDRHPKVGMAGAKLVAPNGEMQVSCFRFYKLATIVYRRTWLGRTRLGMREVGRFEMSDYDRQDVREVDWIQGSCMMVRREALREVGLMDDENFFMYFEDVDWCRRFWEKGWRVVFVSQVEFVHFHQRSSEGGGLVSVLTNKATRWHIESAIKYFKKYAGKPTPH